MGKLRIPKTESKSDPPQLSPRAVAFLQDMEELFRQFELDGCPAATVAGFRESLQIAAAQTLAESARRSFLLGKIKQSIDKLRPKRFMSGFPEGSPEALDELEGFASQLPDKAETQSILKRVKQLRGCLLEGCER